jgi:hypothetical protein
MRNAHYPEHRSILAEIEQDARDAHLAEFHALMEDPDERAYWEAMQEERMEEFADAVDAGMVDEKGDLL